MKKKKKSQQFRKRLKETIEAFKALETKHEEFKQTGESLRKLQMEVTLLQEEKNEWIKERTELSKELENAKNDAKQWEERSRALMDEINNKDNIIQDDRKKLQELQTQLNELTQTLQNLQVPASNILKEEQPSNTKESWPAVTIEESNEDGGRSFCFPHDHERKSTTSSGLICHRVYIFAPLSKLSTIN